jgi:hypothetical protein
MASRDMLRKDRPPEIGRFRSDTSAVSKTKGVLRPPFDGWRTVAKGGTRECLGTSDAVGCPGVGLRPAIHPRRLSQRVLYPSDRVGSDEASRGFKGAGTVGLPTRPRP